MYSFDEVLNYDPEVAKAMDDELGRQRSHIELIASENLVSKAVMAAMGSLLTNTLKDIQERDITVAASMLTLLKLLPLRELRSFLAVSMQMYSLIQEHRPTLQHSLQWLSREIL